MAAVDAPTESVAVLIQTWQRDINCLTDPNRHTRKRALEKLQKKLVSVAGKDKGGPTEPELAEFFHRCLRAPLVALLADPIEKCRELACTMLGALAAGALRTDAARIGALLQDLIPMLLQRVGVPNAFAEPAEELRLQLLELFDLVLRLPCVASPAEAPGTGTGAGAGAAGGGKPGPGMLQHGGSCGGLLGDAAELLAAASTDTFPDVKKRCCSAMLALCNDHHATAAAPAAMRHHALPLAKACLANLVHQHSKVRQLCLQVLGALVPLGSEEGFATLMREQLLPAMRHLTRDRTATVRKQAIETLFGWLSHPYNDAAGGGGAAAAAAAAVAAATGGVGGGGGGAAPPAAPAAASSSSSSSSSSMVIDEEEAEEEDGAAAAAPALIAQEGALGAALGGSAEFAAAVLQLALAGMSDEAPEIAALALARFEALAAAWAAGGGAAAAVAVAREAARAAAAPPVDAELLPPPFSARPSAAARAMVATLLPLVLPAVASELGEWTVRARSLARSR